MVCWELKTKTRHLLGYLGEMLNPNMQTGSTQTCHVMTGHEGKPVVSQL